MVVQHVFIAPKVHEVTECIQFARKHQLALELCDFMYPERLIAMDDNIRRYQDYLKDFEFPIAMHGPVFDVNPVSLDPQFKALSIARYEQAIECALALNARYLVFHSQWTPIYKVADCYQPWLEGTVQFYQSLHDKYLRDSDLTLVIENFLDDSPLILNDLVGNIRSPQVCACLDIGHVNLFSQLAPNDWLDQLGSNLAYIHAHNNWGRLDEHLPFHEGCIDMNGFLNHAARVPRSYQLVVEVLSLDGIEESLLHLDSYLHTKPALPLQQGVPSFIL